MGLFLRADLVKGDTPGEGPRPTIKTYAQARRGPREGESLNPPTITVKPTRAGRGKAKMTGGGGTRVSMGEMVQQGSVHGGHPPYFCKTSGVKVHPPSEEHIPHKPDGMPNIDRITRATAEGASFDDDSHKVDRTVAQHPGKIEFQHGDHPGYEGMGKKKGEFELLNNSSASHPFRPLSIEHINDGVSPLHEVDRSRKIVSEGPLSSVLKEQKAPSQPPHVDPRGGDWGETPKAKRKLEQPASRGATAEEKAGRPVEKEEPSLKQQSERKEIKTPPTSGPGLLSEDFAGRGGSGTRLVDPEGDPGRGLVGKTGTDRHRKKLQQMHKLYVSQGKIDNALKVEDTYSKFFPGDKHPPLEGVDKGVGLYVRDHEKSFGGPEGEKFGKPVSEKTGQGCVSDEIKQLKKQKDYPQERAVAAALNICGESKKSLPLYVAL